MENIRDLLLKAIDTGEEKYCQVCKVLTVDKDANTCDVEPLNGGAELVEIRLQAQNSKGIVAYPMEGSIVIVSFLNKDDGYISMLSEIESYALETATESLKDLLEDLIDELINLKVTTNAGASINVINTPQLQAIKSRLSNFLSK
jgi:hypothetical protein